MTQTITHNNLINSGGGASQGAYRSNNQYVNLQAKLYEQLKRTYQTNQHKFTMDNKCEVIGMLGKSESPDIELANLEKNISNVNIQWNFFNGKKGQLSHEDKRAITKSDSQFNNSNSHKQKMGLKSKTPN